jgi:competence protein ComEA
VPHESDPFDRLRGMDDDETGPPLARPRPGHPLLGRLHDRVDPWLAWFGAGRVLAVLATVVAVVIGGWWLLRPATAPTEAGLPYAAPPGASSGSPAPTASAAAPTAAVPTTGASKVVVHVAGAVASAGVYELPAGARTGDAVGLAGGPAADADVDALNLAAPLRDGERVYVPTVGEVVPPPVAVPGSTVAAGPVDLNRAGAAELDALPGIGPATAQAIVDHRAANGPFASVDDLEQVRGIGPAKLATIRPLVTT